MDADVRDIALYREVTDLFRRLNEPFGEVAAATELSAAPDGTRVAFAGTVRKDVESDPVLRVCVADLGTGAVEQVTAGPHNDRAPAWSPDGRTIAFLSDRRHPGRYGLYLLEEGRLGEAVAAPELDGSAEWLAWSPDGRGLLVGVAGAGAEKSGVEGSGRVADGADRPAWLPHVTTGDTSGSWRRAYRYDVASRTLAPLSREGLNVWEATWCGNDAVAAIVSESPGEDAWYDAPLALIDAATGTERLLHKPRDGRQLGWPAATPDGARVAVVEAVCSDRWVVSGEVLVVDTEGGGVTEVGTAGAGATHLHWRGTTLSYAGERGLDTVVGEHDTATGETAELWCGAAAMAYEPHPAFLPDGTAVLELQAWDRQPQLAVVGRGVDRCVHAFPQGASVEPPGTERRVRWTADDGLEIEALLYEPAGQQAPYPTVLHIHGGPVGREFSKAPARQRFVTALLARGYAVLVPNVRGSSGRGQDFAATVVGDMGGAETRDHLAGLRHLVAEGVVDPERIGVMGGSHGGFETAWLVTQAPDTFAAAVAISPVTDWRSQHLTSNIAHFDAVFVAPMGDPLREERSPVLHADKVRTPTFLTAGDVDRCTPPGQALEFHQALLERGVPTACAIYPGEGHGVRRYPAVLDWTTRVVGWFEEWMPARK
ncbi:MAG TPA: S9 family peptidase [Mycobacteriales bacterium]|nr:S9 family peptidase [Mycobacteriales bacterium]